jgi:hypothetical protein
LIVRVLDLQGKGVSGIKVLAEDTSATSVQKTDGEGEVQFWDKGDLIAVEVNGRLVLKSSLFHRLSTRHGLTVVCIGEWELEENAKTLSDGPGIASEESD